MKNRKNNYPFGTNDAGFYINTPEAVAQACVTRLLLFKTEWFADLNSGTDWAGKILGKAGINQSAEREIYSRIADTPGVVSIVEFNTSIIDRALTVNAVIETTFGEARINQWLGQL